VCVCCVYTCCKIQLKNSNTNSLWDYFEVSPSTAISFSQLSGEHNNYRWYLQSFHRVKHQRQCQHFLITFPLARSKSQISGANLIKQCFSTFGVSSSGKRQIFKLLSRSKKNLGYCVTAIYVLCTPKHKIRADFA